MKVGLITIGQSPRTDVTPTIRKILGREVELVERGALDGLSKKEIDKLAPATGDYILITRIKDGTSVRITKKCISSGVQKCVDELEEMNVDLTLFLCTGEFPEIRTKKLLIEPDELIANIVWGILKCGKLGVVVPEEEQIPLMRKKWKKKGVAVVMVAANPYGQIKACEEAAAFLAEENVDLIILDCIGFTTKVKELFRRLTGKPVILPQTILARILKELVSV